LTDLDSAIHLVQTYGLLVGGVGAGLTGTALVARQVRKALSTASRIAQLLEAQLQPNGGGSLVDKVNKIQPNHEAAETHWKALEVNQTAMKREMADGFRAINRRLEEGDRRFERLEDGDAR